MDYSVYLSPNHHFIIAWRGAIMIFEPLQPGKNSATLIVLLLALVTRTHASDAYSFVHVVAVFV